MKMLAYWRYFAAALAGAVLVILTQTLWPHSESASSPEAAHAHEEGKEEAGHEHKEGEVEKGEGEEGHGGEDDRMQRQTDITMTMGRWNVFSWRRLERYFLCKR